MSAAQAPAEGWDCIVVGGGPGGATCAAYMARQGHRTLVLEKEQFPRYRIGESLLPSMMPLLDDFGLIEEIEACGFPRKTGGTFIWGASAEPWDVLFGENPFLPYPYSYHVERSIFDRIMLRNAADQGATVRQGVTVDAPLTDAAGRVTGVRVTTEDGSAEELAATFVVDASGPASVIGRQVATRHYDDRMKQVAFYRYYENTRGPQNFREGHVIVVSCPKGWFWWIPVADDSELGDTSVGLVTGQEFKEEYTAKGKEAFFEEALAEAPYMQELLGEAATESQPMRAVTDWAYACDRMAGPGFFLVGDAAAFLDPMLSTGVTMAMLAGYSASACMTTALQDPTTEDGVAGFYDGNYRRMWEVTRDFLHYFYAGNQSVDSDDIFWQARRMLKLDDNVGAKQAFCFMVNTIPANPHPALRKQIHMFQQFMTHLDHPMEAMASDEDFQGALPQTAGWVEIDRLDDAMTPVVNGKLEESWHIDADSHRVLPVRGLAYDQERPVFSSTSSWLLGRNLHPLPPASCDLLELCDGRSSWGDVLGRHAERAGVSVDAARAELTPRLRSLYDERFVLLRG